jgi:hypothetical protein
MLGNSSKQTLWDDFVSAHAIVQCSVPLFSINSGCVDVFPYGRDKRLVLKRSGEMELLMRRLGQQLINEFRQKAIMHDGILYLMFRREEDAVIPLYFGKAEILGKGEANLSANISDLTTGDGKFGRWGYNYAYHIGDLSAVTLPGHPDDKQTRKYDDWRRSLFLKQADLLTTNGDIRFWACLWGPEQQSIWSEFGTTRLAFEEYLLIGIASELFPNDLLNREGRNRLGTI